MPETAARMDARCAPLANAMSASRTIKLHHSESIAPPISNSSSHATSCSQRSILVMVGVRRGWVIERANLCKGTRTGLNARMQNAFGIGASRLQRSQNWLLSLKTKEELRRLKIADGNSKCRQRQGFRNPVRPRKF